MNFW